MSIGIINIVPILIWLWMMPLSDRFANIPQTMTNLGRVFALLGFSLMATTIILTVRFHFLEWHLRGLNRVYINHHILGSLAFILLLFHPLFLAMNYAFVSIRSAAIFLLPSFALWSQTLGTLSLVIMIILLFITFYLSWRYHIWKFSHRFLVLAFFIGFLHMAFIDSDTSRNIILRSYLLSFGGLALVSYAYFSLMEFGKIGKYAYIVKKVRRINLGVLEIILLPVGKSLNYHAGQFAFLSVLQKGLSTENHPFSFVSSPDESELRFIIKELGDYTKALDSLKVGTSVFVDGPYGTFGLDNEKSIDQIWIAGGIGITPFLGLAKNLNNDKRHIDLYLCFRSPNEAIYLPELQNLTQINPRLKIIPFYSEERGHLSVNKIEELSGSLIHKHVYICGPIQMMKSLKEQCILKGIPAGNIHTEEFSL
jgi:predicted ferric reductase